MSPDDEVVPCPTCWLLADLLPPLAGGALFRSSCPRGHENSLAPVVLDYLQSLLGPAFRKSA
jgi:hypothetical protein